MPNDNIMGIPTRACINGITKDDKNNIDSIPSLDDRITALEQSSGGNDYSWNTESVRFLTYSGIANVINDYFDYDEENEAYILKYDTVIKYHGYIKFVPKGFDYFELSFNFNEIDNPSGSNLRICSYNFNAQEFFFNEPQDDTKFFRNSFRWIITNPSGTTFTFNNYSGEESRTTVLFYFKNKVNNN